MKGHLKCGDCARFVDEDYKNGYCKGRETETDRLHMRKKYYKACRSIEPGDNLSGRVIVCDTFEDTVATLAKLAHAGYDTRQIRPFVIEVM